MTLNLFGEQRQTAALPGYHDLLNNQPAPRYISAITFFRNTTEYDAWMDVGLAAQQAALGGQMRGVRILRIGPHP